MGFWQSLWTAVWFGGLAVFAILSVIVVFEGGKELRALLQRVEEEEGKSA